jgi:hypothetical protein
MEEGGLDLVWSMSRYIRSGSVLALDYETFKRTLTSADLRLRMFDDLHLGIS